MSKYIFTLLALVTLTLGAGCGTSPSTTNEQQQTQNATKNSPVAPQPEAVPTLANLGGITFGAYDTTTQLAGDIRMDATRFLDLNSGHVVPMYLFGQALPGRTTVQLNPNLEFGGLKNPITLVSAIDGVVGFVREQASSSDYEVFLQPKEGSEWTIGYDHVTDVTVKQGDRVTVGQTIGKAARENNGTYRYELQINRDLNGITTFHCPTELLAPTVKADYTQKIERFIRDWNTMMGKNSYGAITTSCTKPILTTNETQ